MDLTSRRYATLENGSIIVSRALEMQSQCTEAMIYSDMMTDFQTLHRYLGCRWPSYIQSADRILGKGLRL